MSTPNPTPTLAELARSLAESAVTAASLANSREEAVAILRDATLWDSSLPRTAATLAWHALQLGLSKAAAIEAVARRLADYFTDHLADCTHKQRKEPPIWLTRPSSTT